MSSVSKKFKGSKESRNVCTLLGGIMSAHEMKEHHSSEKSEINYLAQNEKYNVFVPVTEHSTPQ